MNKLIIAILLVAILLGSVAFILLNNSNPSSSSDNNQGLIVDYSGRIVASSDNQVTVNVPAHAVSNRIALSIQKNTVFPSVSGFTSIVGYKFGPEGTVFQKPVTIQMAYDQSA